MAALNVIPIFISFAIFVTTANCACFPRASCVNFFAKQQIKYEEIAPGDQPNEYTIANVHIKNWKKRDFLMQEKLGEGKYGEVWKAMNIRDSKFYAVKKISKGKDTAVSLIRNEIGLQRKMNSKFVVQLYNAFQDSSAYYLQLELVEGRTLFDLINSHGKFSEDAARFYAAEILCAIEYIHDNDIIFRDLKPENILLTDEGHVKIADFGMAKDIRNVERRDSICGTPGYIAPEILLAHPYTKAVDIWSLGVIIYAMIAGYNPFHGKSMLQTLCNVHEMNVTYDRKYFSIDAEGLLKHVLDRDPKQRYNISQTKGHEWFIIEDKTNWPKVENQQYEPPFRHMTVPPHHRSTT